jgi:pimeloyl-ACP methyl ester carboxylesterase
MERHTCSPGSVEALCRWAAAVDARALLAGPRMPVLVIHRQGDHVAPAPDGRYLAEHIPGAEYAELPGEQTGRRPAAPFAAHRRWPPSPRVRQARCEFPGRADGRVRAGDRLTPGTCGGPPRIRTAPYSVEREIDDIAALIQQAGGSASVFGHSSGATLTLKAAASGLPITHLVLYEPPFNTDNNYPALPASFVRELAELVSAGRRGDAVELYQTKAVGIPKQVVAQMRHAPFRPGLEMIAHTLAYDAAIVGDRSVVTVGDSVRRRA